MLNKKQKYIHPLADFMVNASAKEKKKVYTKVLKQASEAQLEMIERAKEKAAAQQA